MQYDESVLILDAPVDIDEDVLPFGKRWGGQHFYLTDEQMAALRNGKWLALDVENEYVVYLKRKANPVSDSGSESVPVGQRKTPGHGI